MDVFALRNKVVDDYRRYIESFVRIRDEHIEKFVRDKFSSGASVAGPNSAAQSGLRTRRNT